MLRNTISRGSLAIGLVVLATAPVFAQDYKARLDGFFEVGGLGAGETGAILTNGTGKLILDVDQNSASYRLTYSGLTTNVTQAHLHFGKVHVAGGIYAFLCTNMGNGPTGTPACPPTGGTVTGTLTAASIVGNAAAQNIQAGDFNALLAAVGSNTTYANIHTVKFPAGEIRGQVQRSNDEDDERGHNR